MKVKMKKVLLCVISLFMFISLASCGSNDKYADMVKATFVLEGGMCRGYGNDVVYLYDFEDDEEVLIYDPNSLEENEEYQIIMNNYHIEGWYQTKTEDGEYENRWDFSKDKMTKDGITLYAKWKKNVVYSYEVYIQGEDEPLDTLIVEEGAKFNDITLDLDVDGYTNIQYLDENLEPWDDNFRHPGGETDTAIKIYLDLIEGDFKIVKTASQLKSSKGHNIYLANDIDFDGDSFAFEEYGKIFLGNGHKISNFVVKTPTAKAEIGSELTTTNSIYSSIFYNINGATIKDVTFDNVTFEINNGLAKIKNIVVSPLATMVSNATIENVIVNGTYKIDKVHTSTTLTLVEDSMFYIKDKSYDIDNSSNYTIIVQDNR